MKENVCLNCGTALTKHESFYTLAGQRHGKDERGRRTIDFWTRYVCDDCAISGVQVSFHEYEPRVVMRAPLYIEED